MNVERMTDYIEALDARSGYLAPMVTGEQPAGLCGTSYRTTRRALGELVELGFVSRHERRGGAAPLVPNAMTEWRVTEAGHLAFLSDEPVDLDGDPLDGESGYVVRYRCPCGNSWTSVWSCACDDECSACDRTIGASSYRLDGTASARALDAYNAPTRRPI